MRSNASVPAVGDGIATQIESHQPAVACIISPAKMDSPQQQQQALTCCSSRRMTHPASDEKSSEHHRSFKTEHKSGATAWAFLRRQCRHLLTKESDKGVETGDERRHWTSFDRIGSAGADVDIIPEACCDGKRPCSSSATNTSQWRAGFRHVCGCHVFKVAVQDPQSFWTKMASFLKRSKQRRRTLSSSHYQLHRSRVNSKRAHGTQTELTSSVVNPVTNSYPPAPLTRSRPASQRSPPANTVTNPRNGANHSSSEYSDRLIAALTWNKDDFKVYHYDEDESDPDEENLMNDMAFYHGSGSAPVAPEEFDPRVPEDGAAAGDDEDDDASSVSDDENFTQRPAPGRYRQSSLFGDQALYYQNMDNVRWRIRQRQLERQRAAMGMARPPVPTPPFNLRPSLIGKKSIAASYDFPGFLKAREAGFNVLNQSTRIDFLERFDDLLRHEVLKERQLPLEPKIDKIFTAEWINDKLVVFGTKCNKIIVYDTRTGKSSPISTLDRPTSTMPPPHPSTINRPTKRRKGNTASVIAPWSGAHEDANLTFGLTKLPKEYARGGIYAVRINRAGDLFVTSGYYATDVAVYKLPDFTPVSLGVGAHRDIIFDIAWVSDRVFVSGSRDCSVALWKVDEEDIDRLAETSTVGKRSPPSTPPDFSCGDSPAINNLDLRAYSEGRHEEGQVDSWEVDEDELPVPSYPARRALRVRHCFAGDKVRALSYNPKYPEVAALTMNNFLHVFEPTTLRQKYSKKLPMTTENVCLTVNEDKDLYAVGCKSIISIIDGRTITPTDVCIAPIQEIGLRSLSFRGNTVTIGTGYGRILFYDVRNQRFLKSEVHAEHPVALISSYGFPKTMSRENTPEVQSIASRQNQQPMPPGTVDVHLERIQGHRIDRSRGIALDLDHFNYNMPAIYTNCYDPSGTRLLTAGGPLHVGYRGAYAAIWQ